MAKLKTVLGNKPIATSIEGVYVKNLPAKTIEDKFGNIAEKLEEDAEGTITLLFNELICDEKGEAFEDVETFEAISSALSILEIHAIINAIPEALVPSAATSKK